MDIRFNIPYKSKNEIKYIENAIHFGKTSGDGKYSKLCEKKIEEILSSKKVFMTTSCTHALELAFELIDINGFEVLLPTYNFPSAANAVIRNGGKVIFTETYKDNLCIDVSKIEVKITKQTKAILVVHYGGSSCDMDVIMKIAKKYHLFVIEDAAQGFLSGYKGKMLGTIGDFGCFSFHETKNITCGEGGALSINLNDPIMVEKANEIRQKGTNRSAYSRGDVAFYEWVRKGSSYSPSEVLMAYLYGQLEDCNLIQAKRKKIFTKYLNFFIRNEFICVDYFSKGNKYGDFNFHTFYVVFKNDWQGDYFREQLNKRGIKAYTHFVPLHLSEMGKKLGYKLMDFQFEAQVYNKLIRLPLHSMMTEQEIEFIIIEIEKVILRIENDINNYTCI